MEQIVEPPRPPAPQTSSKRAIHLLAILMDRLQCVSLVPSIYKSEEKELYATKNQHGCVPELHQHVHTGLSHSDLYQLQTGMKKFSIVSIQNFSNSQTSAQQQDPQNIMRKSTYIGSWQWTLAATYSGTTNTYYHTLWLRTKTQYQRHYTRNKNSNFIPAATT